MIYALLVKCTFELKVYDMPIEFPKPRRLTSAGYAPVQDDVPLAPPTPTPALEPEPVAGFECRIKIYAPKSDLSSLKLGVFSLSKSDNEESVRRWRSEEALDSARYTVLTGECHVEEPKKLTHEFHQNVGICTSFDVTPRPIDSEYFNVEFIPLLPSLESESKLGWALHGFYYYFYEGKLLYELDILGGGKWAWRITQSSSSDGISSSPVSDQVFSSLLVPVKIEGKEPEKQHILYSRGKLTNEQLAEVNVAWLDENATLIDTDLLVSSLRQPLLPREIPSDINDTAAKDIQTHKVNMKDNGQHESWSDIAGYYDLSPKELLKLNPSFEQDPMALRAGDVLIVEKSDVADETQETKEFPSPLTEINVGESYVLGNTWGKYNQPRLSPSMTHIFELQGISQTTPVLNVKKVEEKILRIGVFFDGTGQNHLNDLYKETRGVKSRTNVARLFEIYPLDDDTNKIYVAGVGTVDGAWQNPTLIDEGKDEVDLAQAFGVSPDNLGKTSTFMDTAYNLVADDTGAFYKWQNWTKQFYGIITELIRQQKYQAITHIEFDVFGFSRGAALARHFVNAVKDGLPDYNKPRDGEALGEVFPNLLAHQDDISSQPKHGYYPDETRTCSVRFVGLFDTVGSFYLAGNNDEGNFELGLDTRCAERVFQISAHHEYRKNFPLTSLLPSDGILPSNFYEEVFAGCHTDIGGGYPSKEQYAKQGLPERYGMPLSATYNRELIKTESIRQEIQAQQNVYGAAAYSERLHKRAQEAWNLECSTKGLYGVVTLVNGLLYYYELQPISNALSALSLERMKQQAEVAGVNWDDEKLAYPQDFSQVKGNDVALKTLNEKLLAQPLGSIAPTHWQGEISQYGKEWIHRPHDALINAGCETAMDNLVNAVTKEGNQLKRVVFDNEV
ncbi:phospholipase effector Tle1 domain-containing protein [Vibrio parahaemolyticus]